MEEIRSAQAVIAPLMHAMTSAELQQSTFVCLSLRILDSRATSSKKSFYSSADRKTLDNYIKKFIAAFQAKESFAAFPSSGLWKTFQTRIGLLDLAAVLLAHTEAIQATAPQPREACLAELNEGRGEVRDGQGSGAGRPTGQPRCRCRRNLGRPPHCFCRRRAVPRSRRTPSAMHV
jgi:hypothetical protein